VTYAAATVGRDPSCGATPPTRPAATAIASSPQTTTPPSPDVANTQDPGALDLGKYSVAGFRSPSGHIGCLFTTLPKTYVRCDVNDAAWHITTPATCHLAYGDSVDLTTTAGLGCHGDTVIGAVPHQPTLAYGRTVRYHGITCSSAETGVTCRNQAGHGFVVARQTYRLF